MPVADKTVFTSLFVLSLLETAAITTMAEKYGVSVPQLAIKYCLQPGLLPLPKASSAGHMKNKTELDFEIFTVDMATFKTVKMADYGSDQAFPVYSGKQD